MFGEPLWFDVNGVVSCLQQNNQEDQWHWRHSQKTKCSAAITLMESKKRQQSELISE